MTENAESKEGKRKWGRRVVRLAYFLLTLYLVCATFTNKDESGNLAAGLSIWKYGRFDLYSVNPPLVKAVAAAPLTLCRPTLDWKDYERNRLTRGVGDRHEFAMAVEFVRDNKERLRILLVLARLACLPFLFVGAYYCRRWATELFDARAGNVAFALWALCPNLLTWGTLALSDAAAASAGVAFAYCFWRWLKDPAWSETQTVGLALGVALLTKFTWLVLFAVMPILTLADRALCVGERRVSLRAQFGRLAVAALVGVFIVNLGYCFEGSFRRLGDFQFASRALAGKDAIADGGDGGNRFADSFLGAMPAPLPENYLIGIDLQKVDFENGLPSYLNGRWSQRGWVYYYLECALLKIPLGAWALFLVAAALAARRILIARDRATARAWLCFVLIGGGLFCFVSSQPGFSRHFRYVLPALPFFYVAAAGAFHRVEERSKTFRVALCALLAWFGASSLWVYPHCMSYFNELAGGPIGGSRYLLDSNIDWGQDVWALRARLDRCGRRDVALLNRDSLADAFFAERNYPTPPELRDQLPRDQREDDESERDLRTIGPRPGLFAVSVHQLRDEFGRWRYFNDLEPTERFGYSIFLYDVSWDDANRLRRKYQLPPLVPPDVDVDRFLRERVALADVKRPTRVAYLQFANDDPQSLADVRRALDDEIFQLEVVAPQDVRDGALDAFDLLVAPGGAAREQRRELGASGAKKLRQFVEEGGGYLGICAGAFLASAREEYPLRLVNVRPPRARCGVLARRPRDASAPSPTVVDLAPTPEGAQLLALADADALKGAAFAGGPILSRDYQRDLPPVVALATFATSPVQTSNALSSKDDLTIGEPAITISSYGDGAVCLSSAHLERGGAHDAALARLALAVARSSGTSTR